MALTNDLLIIDDIQRTTVRPTPEMEALMREWAGSAIERGEIVTGWTREHTDGRVEVMTGWWNQSKRGDESVSDL